MTQLNQAIVNLALATIHDQLRIAQQALAKLYQQAAALQAYVDEAQHWDTED